MQSVDNSKALGLLVRKERIAQRLTQAELAALTGVGIRFVREFELGKESCRVGLAFQVMRTLGLNLQLRNRKEVAP